MRSKFQLGLLALVASIGLGFSSASFSAGLSEVLGTKSKDAVQTTSPADEDVPQWLRDSRRLSSLLGDSAEVRIENPKVIRKIETPVPGLQGFIVQADTFSKASPDGKQELYVFYSDKTGRYLVVGMMIDTKKDRDLNQVYERYVRGEMSDNPARALRPEEMRAVMLKGGKSSAVPLDFVIDLGPQEGKSSLLTLVALHKELVTQGANPRPVRIVLVSSGKDELSTGAMAMAIGFDQFSGDGVAKLIEFAQKGRATSWLDAKRMKSDAKLKRAIGTGIFALSENSTQALLARLDTLPLVYESVHGQTTFVPLPASKEEWRMLLTK